MNESREPSREDVGFSSKRASQAASEIEPTNSAGRFKKYPMGSVFLTVIAVVSLGLSWAVQHQLQQLKSRQIITEKAKNEWKEDIRTLRETQQVLDSSLTRMEAAIAGMQGTVGRSSTGTSKEILLLREQLFKIDEKVSRLEKRGKALD